MTGISDIEILAELAVLNGYNLGDDVLVVYSYDGGVKRAVMSLGQGLEKLRKKLSKEPSTIGIDIKIYLYDR